MRGIGWLASVVALLTLPLAAFALEQQGHSLTTSVILASFGAAAFRGGLDLLLRRLRLTEAADLFGSHDEKMREEDALLRRRQHFWKKKFRLIGIVLSGITALWLIRGGSWGGNASWIIHSLSMLKNPQVLMQLIILPIFFAANFLLFFGPMMMMGISQMRGLEPGDADFGVKLGDVRGQAEAKEEISKVITLWQSGTKFAKAGGKRERGILFLGPPGTGKTMLAKAIATGFNCPIVLMPGSGFAQTFIGMDVIITRYMARKARKLAAKWGGQCIVFIDEIDAVGMRRASLGGGISTISNRDATHPQMPGGMMGGMGQQGLQSLLVIMDGIDNPPAGKRFLVNRVNTWLDALYLVPPSVKFFGGKTCRLRLPKAKPTGNQIYFVGATNVPIEALDPALTRAGRMGRHIYFRTPTKRDRIDIFDLYLGKVAHDPELDTVGAREELGRITQGYSPAEIDQACSLALTYAMHDTRERFSRGDLLEAMVTLEAGTALGWGYESKEEELSTAVHEAGHAVCSALYMDNTESTRLSIRRRGATGGHHQAVELEERSFKDRDELFAELIWILGAYAAEFVFYGRNTQGVGGDLQSASWLAGTMVGRWGMSYRRIGDDDMDNRFNEIGQILVTAAGKNDIKLSVAKGKTERILLGQAFCEAYNTIIENKAAVDKIAKSLLREKEIYGDDLVKLLDSCGLQRPEIVWEEAESFPQL